MLINVVLMGIVGSSIDDTVSCEYEKGMTLKQLMIFKNKGPVNAKKQHWNFRQLSGVDFTVPGLRVLAV